MSEYICRGCGNVLEEYELLYYSHTCESCEIKLQARIELWRRGEDDQELDQMFNDKLPTQQ